MYFNPVIIIALILQGFIAKASRLAGAIIGGVITTGILIWGLSAYQQGNWITFFGIKLSQAAFLVFCLVWYLFDLRDLLLATRQQRASEQRVADQNASSPISTREQINPNNDPYYRPRPVNASTHLNKYCVVCGQEYGPTLESHCTKNSLLAISNEGRFKKRKKFYTLDGFLLDDMDVDSIRARETAVYKRERAGY